MSVSEGAVRVLQVLVSDTMVKDGMSLSGLRLGVKNSRFEFNYDVVRC